MKTNTYFQRFKIVFFYGARLVAGPALFIYISLILFLSMGLDQAMWDVDFFDGVVISLLVLAPSLILTLLGITLVSLIVSSNKRFSDIAASILGIMTGVVMLGIAYLASTSFELMDFYYTSMPSAVPTLLLAYAAPEMNRRASLDVESPEAPIKFRRVLLQAVLWMAVIACVGSIAWVLTDAGYLDMLTIYVYLGYALSISLPVILLAGLFIHKIPKPAFLTWPIWQKLNHAIHRVFTRIQKGIGSHAVLKIIAFILLVSGILFGITHIMLITPSDRELWRITDYDISRPVVVNDLFIFHGYREDRSVDCHCLYAVNKSTGEMAWSTEELARPYMEEVERLGLGYSDFFSVGTGVASISENRDVLYIILSYPNSDDDARYVLLAVKSNNGEILWEVDGITNYDSFPDSVMKTDQFFVIDENGDLLAINSYDGKEIWRHSINDYDEDETSFRFHNNTVFVSIYSSECLTCCCTFSSDRQQYEQITAFSAETGQALWETERLDSGIMYLIDQTLYMVSDPWENSSEVEKRDDELVTAIDLETGGKRWDLILPDAHELQVNAGGKDSVLFFVRTYEGGSENFHELAKLIAVDEFTGMPAWQFNEDFSRGNLGYLVDDTVIYAGSEDGDTYSLDSATGDVIWQAKGEGFPFHFVVQGNTLLGVYEESYVSAWDADNGDQKWKLDLGVDENPSLYWENIQGISKDTVFIAGNNNHKIYAVDIKTGDELWTWSHFRPTYSGYEIELIDDNILYVNQQPQRNITSLFMPRYFARDDWYFALKTDPE
jgi:outer membrane protein assembly factor BamB